MRAGANQSGVGHYNERVVLHAIRPAGGISQTELVTHTGLATQTVSVIVNQLLARGEIRVSGVQPVGRGRPRSLLEIVPEAGFALGVHLDPAVVTLVVLNLAGRVVGSSHHQFTEQDPGLVTGSIAANARDLIAKSGVPAPRILGACVAAPGVVDAEAGCMVNPLWLPPSWGQYPLRDRLSEQLGMPTSFIKDTRAAITGETWVRADASDQSSLVFFYLGTGVGVGLAINGEAVGGASGNAGEVGRVLVGLGQDVDDDYAGRGMDNDPGILVRRAIRSGAISGELASLETLAGIDAAFRELCRAADRGEPEPVDILRAAGGRVAAAAAAVAETVDADEVVFGGPYWELVRPYYEPECVRLLGSLGEACGHPVRATGSTMGADVSAIGAAAWVLDGHYVPRASTLSSDSR